MKVNVVVGTVTGEKFVGDSDEGTLADVQRLEDFFHDLTKFTYLSLEINGNVCTFNPNHVVYVAVNTEE